MVTRKKSAFAPKKRKVRLSRSMPAATAKKNTHSFPRKIASAIRQSSVSGMRIVVASKTTHRILSRIYKANFILRQQDKDGCQMVKSHKRDKCCFLKKTTRIFIDTDNFPNNQIGWISFS